MRCIRPSWIWHRKSKGWPYRRLSSLVVTVRPLTAHAIPSPLPKDARGDRRCKSTTSAEECPGYRRAKTAHLKTRLCSSVADAVPCPYLHGKWPAPCGHARRTPRQWKECPYLGLRETMQSEGLSRWKGKLRWPRSVSPRDIILAETICLLLTHSALCTSFCPSGLSRFASPCGGVPNAPCTPGNNI